MRRLVALIIVLFSLGLPTGIAYGACNPAHTGDVLERGLERGISVLVVDADGNPLGCGQLVPRVGAAARQYDPSGECIGPVALYCGYIVVGGLIGVGGAVCIVYCDGDGPGIRDDRTVEKPGCEYTGSDAGVVNQASVFCSGGGGEINLVDLKRLPPDEIERCTGEHPEDFKRAYVHGSVSEFDVYRDSKTGQLIIVSKRGLGSVPIPTGVYC